MVLYNYYNLIYEFNLKGYFSGVVLFYVHVILYIYICNWSGSMLLSPVDYRNWARRSQIECRPSVLPSSP